MENTFWYSLEVLFSVGDLKKDMKDTLVASLLPRQICVGYSV